RRRHTRSTRDWSSDVCSSDLGPAKLGDEHVMLVCHQKGRDMKEKQFHNLGMPHPEGYRKAARLMQQAEKFGFPVICLIDTPGALDRKSTRLNSSHEWISYAVF